jgi:hypothetical protein
MYVACMQCRIIKTPALHAGYLATVVAALSHKSVITSRCHPVLKAARDDSNLVGGLRLASYAVTPGRAVLG